MESNRICGRYRSIACVLVGLGLMAAALPASALLIDINTYVTGSLMSGVASVGQLTATQNGADVDFSFSNSVNNLHGGIGDDAFISKLLFSYSGASALTSSSFVNFGGMQLITASDFDINPPGKDAGYDFYIGLDFPTRSSARFVDGESSSWTIRNVLLDDFMDPVTGSGPASSAMVHVQQVGAGLGGESSLKYVAGDGEVPPQEIPSNPIPEPGSLALTMLGLLGLAVLRTRKNSRKNNARVILPH
jgi:hypothetical protein